MKSYRVTLQHKTLGLVHYDHYHPVQLELLKQYVDHTAKGYNATVVEIELVTVFGEEDLKSIPKFFGPRSWTDEEAKEAEDMCSLRLGISPKCGGYDLADWMDKFYSTAETFPAEAAVATYAERYGLDYI